MVHVTQRFDQGDVELCCDGKAHLSIEGRSINKEKKSSGDQTLDTAVLSARG
jgi:hypothetical protein